MNLPSVRQIKDVLSYHTLRIYKDIYIYTYISVYIHTQVNKLNSQSYWTMSSKSGIDLRLRVRLTPLEPTLLHETRCFIGSHTQKSATADRAVIFIKVMHKWRICGSISCWPEGGIINSKKCFVQFEGRAGISGWQQYRVRRYGGRYLEAVTQKWENILPPVAQWCSRLFTRSLLIVDIIYI